ncbi:MAG: hypothetical protein AB7O97_06190 [Planctomycetota bacterium]
MKSRFEIVQDDQGRFSFRLLDADAKVLLSGLPSAGKIAVQTEVLHARNAVRAGDRFVPHEDRDGKHFVVLKDRDGSVLARSPHVADDRRLRDVIARIEECAPGAPLLDMARV